MFLSSADGCKQAILTGVGFQIRNRHSQYAHSGNPQSIEDIALGVVTPASKWYEEGTLDSSDDGYHSRQTDDDLSGGGYLGVQRGGFGGSVVLPPPSDGII